MSVFVRSCFVTGVELSSLRASMTLDSTKLIDNEQLAKYPALLSTPYVERHIKTAYRNLPDHIFTNQLQWYVNISA